jgi:CheY-like chemotaxis protein
MRGDRHGSPRRPGYGLPEDRQRSPDAGFDVHLVKPIEQAALEALLAKRASASDASQ